MGSLFLVVLGGCTAKLEGEITIDGKAEAVETCRSGQALGFRGVELTTASGNRVRAQATMTGDAEVALLAAGAQTGTAIPGCATLTVADQNSTINDIRNVAGVLTLACSSSTPSLVGTVKFANCH